MTQQKLIPIAELKRMKSMKVEEALRNPEKAYKVYFRPEDVDKLYLLKNVQYLRASSKVTRLPDRIGELSFLQVLDLKSCNISFLPKGLGKLKHLYMLDLVKNPVKEFPSSMATLPQLKHVYLSDLKEVPKGLTKIKSIEHLGLYGNEYDWEQTFEELGKLPRLHKLNLSEFTSLPSTSSKLENLEELFFWVCPKLDSDQVFGRLHLFKKLKHAYFMGCNINDIPDSFANHPTLEIVNLFSNPLNEIKHILKVLSSLKKLRTLQIGGGKYTHMPDEIGLLTGLKELYLSGTKVTSLPSTIKELKQLQKLAGVNWFPESEKAKIKQALPNVELSDDTVYKELLNDY
jgi:Leucine-rich repeat (LRR) protein